MVRIKTGDTIPLVAFGKEAIPINQTSFAGGSGGSITAGTWFHRDNNSFQASKGVKVIKLVAYLLSATGGSPTDLADARIYNVTQAYQVGILQSGVTISEVAGWKTFTGSVILDGDDGDIYAVQVRSTSENYFWYYGATTLDGAATITTDGASARLIKYDGTIIEVTLEQVVNDVWMTNDIIDVAGTYGLQVFNSPIYEDYANVNQYSLEVGGYADDITNILIDTAEMQPKLPTNNIMGSSVKTDKDDEIDSIKTTVEKIEDAIVVKYGTVTLTGTQLIFRTNMTEANTFWNDTTIIMLTGSNAGQPRRISAFVNLNGQVTVDSPFLNNVTLNDTFIVIGRWTPAGSPLTPAGIAAAVMSEVLPGSYTGSQAGKVIADIKVDSSAILADTNELELDWKDGGRLDLLIDQIITNVGTAITNTNTIITNVGTLDGKVVIVDGVVDEILATIKTENGLVVADGTNTSSYFKTNLSKATLDFYTNIQIKFLTGLNAGPAKRISAYSVAKFITVSEAFANIPLAGDSFVIIGRVAGAGSTLTEASIAFAVFEELLSGHVNIGTAGKIIQDIQTVLASVQSDTNDIQTRIPATLIAGLMRSHIQGKDATLPLSAQEKLDVKLQADNALILYDGPTKAELDLAETHIIDAIDDNEDKIDIMQIDVTLLLSRLGIPPGDLYTALKAEIDTNEALILTLTGNLTTHDAAIKALIGIPIANIITDMNNRFNIVDAANLANYNAIIQIQNNTTTVFLVPDKLVRPDVGTKPYAMIVLNRNMTGTMEDFDANPTIQGDYVSGGALFLPTAMTHDGLGQYSYVFDLAFDEALGTVNIKVSALEGGNPITLIRTSEVTDYDTELEEIKQDTGAIFIKVGAGTPSPTIPDQLTSMESNLTDEIDENQVIVETIRDDATIEVSYSNPAFIKTGYSAIDTETTLPIGTLIIPIIAGTGDTFSDNGGTIIIDKGEANEETIDYISKTDDAITLATPTLIEHELGESVYEQTTTSFHVTIRRKDGMPNIQADDPPTFIILHDDVPSTPDGSGAMTWNAILGRYDGNVVYDIDSIPGKRTGSIAVTIGSVRDYTIDFEVVFRPSSEKQINEAIGTAIEPNTLVFDHLGWIGPDGIKHLWTDDMKGAIKDDAGQPLVCRIKAYIYDPIDVNVPILGPNPRYDNFTNVFGHYIGGLLPGKYLFTFIANGKKWKQVDRYIDYP